MPKSGKTVNKRELAEFFGVSPQAVDGWLSRGCPYIEKGKALHGYKFDTAAVAEWRSEQRAREAIGQNAPDDPTNAEDRIKRADASLKELKLARELGQLVTVEDVQKVWVRIVGTCRTRLLGIPAKITQLVFGAEDVDSARSILEAEIHEALNELADSGAGDIDAGGSEESSDSSSDPSEGSNTSPEPDQAATEADAQRVGGKEGASPKRQRHPRKVSGDKG